MKESTVIEFNNLSIGYKDKSETVTIASGISASLCQGSLVSVAGPNGGGKSTLLRTLAGYLPPLSGNIFINGADVTRISIGLRATSVAVVLTRQPTLNSTSAFDMVSLGRTPYTGFFGNLTNSDKAIIQKAMEITQTWHLKDRELNTLSDGERQKIMIAKAIAQDTPIIILDEPTAFLDYPSKVSVMQLLRKMCENLEKTIILSTHDLEIAFALTSQLWLIDKSKGFVAGTVGELGEKAEIARFFNSPVLHYDYMSRNFIIDNN